MYTTRTHKAPWSGRAAERIALVAAAAVSLFRPVSSTVTEEGLERDVFVLRMENARMARLCAWVSLPSETAGCLHIDILGHYIEVWFVTLRRTTTAEAESA